MAKSLAEYKQDLVEVERLLNLAIRQNAKDLLTAEKVKLQQIVKEMKVSEDKETPKTKKALPTLTLTSYAWDQSEKFVKIYLSNLKGIQSIPTENIKLSANDGQYSVFIEDLNGKNYQFTSPKLLHEVGSYTSKVKENMLLLMLKKVDAEKWSYLSIREKLAKEDKDKVPSVDKDADPSASIMNMMKKMYDEGDDEMKKTIAKAWTESRNKGPDMGGLSGLS